MAAPPEDIVLRLRSFRMFLACLKLRNSEKSRKSNIKSCKGKGVLDVHLVVGAGKSTVFQCDVLESLRLRQLCSGYI